MTRDALVVYGAYGFTGRLILDALRERGVDFVVAGRNGAQVEDVAAAFGARFRVFDLSDVAVVDRELSRVGVLLNAAGPFVTTAAPLVASCLRSAVHYLDVSGEVEPLAHVAGLGDAARSRRVMLLPGIGFDVVPSDCLAVHLARRLPRAERLVLGISGLNNVSRGSARTFAAYAGTPIYVRRAGALEPLLFRTQLRWLDFGGGVRATLAVTWGDLVTAFHSTGIADIEVYFEATPERTVGIVANQYLGWMLRGPWARASLEALADRGRVGPSREELRAGRVIVTGEVSRGARRVAARIETPEAYAFTAVSAAAVAERVMAGAVVPGFQTPGMLLGPDFVLSLAGVVRRDLS
jgi:short subunit dehydrogenase-like uncharacterized protein